MKTGKQLGAAYKDQLGVEPHQVRISPDGNFLLGFSAGLCLWNMEKGKQRWLLTAVKLKPSHLGEFSPNGRMVAVGVDGGGICLLETETGEQRGRIAGSGPRIYSLAFSPCGLLLASGAPESAMVWDVTGKILSASRPVQPFEPEVLDACWTKELAGPDAAKAWQTICDLTLRPDQAVALLKKKLPLPHIAIEAKLRAQLKADLEDDDFAIRERACKELTEIGAPAVYFVRKLCVSGASPEARQRAENVLKKLVTPSMLADERRSARAIEILEYIGSPAARELLEVQARGDPGSSLVRDAKGAVDRISKRPPLR